MDFYQGLVGHSVSVHPLDRDCAVNALKLRVLNQHYLSQPFTCEEIKRALFSMEENETSGIDGYTSGFFKRA